MPQAPDVWFCLLLFSTSQGYFVNLLRMRKSGTLSRHRYAGPVHTTSLRGRRHYLKLWWATEESYVFEPLGDAHTLGVPERVTEMITMLHVPGAYRNPVGVEDVFSKIDAARNHYESVSHGAEVATPLNQVDNGPVCCLP